jgi:MoaA/NifB/PqqE/SkfB family radical SAM enzyme
MHAQAVRAVELFLEEGLYTSVSFVPTRALLSRPEAFWRTLGFIRDLGVHDMRLTSPILSGKLTARPDEALLPEHVALIREAQARLTRTPGEPGCFAYDVFESAEAFGCGAGYNYLFVDSRGNLCPCDFTMMSFGNLRQRPVAEVWRELSERFCQPGCSCYATRIAGRVEASGAREWPLDPTTSRTIHAATPSADPALPAFHQEMGFKCPAGRQL